MDFYLTHNWLVCKIGDRFIENAVQKYPSGKLLDIGCGTIPYKEMFKPYIYEHIDINHEWTLHDKNEIDIYSSATDIPQEGNSYDTIFYGAVLEHPEEPVKIIIEMNRVLKQNGLVVLQLLIC